jgi:hypothetical protein
MDTNTLPLLQLSLTTLQQLLPDLDIILTGQHPYVQFIKGNIGLCMNAIAITLYEMKNLEELKLFTGADFWLCARLENNVLRNTSQSSECDRLPLSRARRNSSFMKSFYGRFGVEFSEDLPGQSMMDDACEYLEKSAQTLLHPSHPWLLRLNVDAE